MTESGTASGKTTTASPKRWLWLVAAWVCILLPVVLLARLMRENLVNIPFLDDYMFTPMFEKARNGFAFTFAHDDNVLTLHDFFLVQMEHRLAFVRALIAHLAATRTGAIFFLPHASSAYRLWASTGPGLWQTLFADRAVTIVTPATAPGAPM